jgi:hypothetical protein
MRNLRVIFTRSLSVLTLVTAALTTINLQQASATTAADCLATRAFCIDAYRNAPPPPDYYWGIIYVSGYNMTPYTQASIYVKRGGRWTLEKTLAADSDGRFLTTVNNPRECGPKIEIQAIYWFPITAIQTSQDSVFANIC